MKVLLKSTHLNGHNQTKELESSWSRENSDMGFPFLTTKYCDNMVKVKKKETKLSN